MMMIVLNPSGRECASCGAVVKEYALISPGVGDKRNVVLCAECLRRAAAALEAVVRKEGE
jgi:hypothetical protein